MLLALLRASDGSLSAFDLIARLSLAALFGGALGLEREYKSKPAGLRTHMLVALGSACFSLAAVGLVREFGTDLTSAARTVTDPTRVVQGVIGGIGFLGAGAIIRNQGSVEGLTTAGSIWLVGAVGIATGAGNYTLATITVVIATVILLALGWVERRIEKDETPSE